MRRHVSLVSAALALAACRSGPAVDAEPLTAASPARSPGTQPRPSAEVGSEYERLLLAVATCPDPQHEVYADCPALAGFRALPGPEPDAPSDERTVVARARITHESPAVRFESALVLERVLERISRDDIRVHEPTLAAMAAALRTETDPETATLVIVALGEWASLQPAAADAVWSRFDDPNEAIRETAVFYALEPGIPLDAERLTRALKAVDTDPVMPLREKACEQLGAHPSDELAAELAKRLADPALEPDVSRSCFEGLVTMWGGEDIEARSEAAYRATLNLLHAEPRDTRHYLQEAIVLFRAGERAEATTWYAREELLAALAAVAIDRTADGFARVESVRTIMALGPGAATLRKLKRAYAKPKDGRDEAIARMLAAPAETP